MCVCVCVCVCVWVCVCVCPHVFFFTHITDVLFIQLHVTTAQNALNSICSFAGENQYVYPSRTHTQSKLFESRSSGQVREDSIVTPTEMHIDLK